MFCYCMLDMLVRSANQKTATSYQATNCIAVHSQLIFFYFLSFFILFILCTMLCVHIYRVASHIASLPCAPCIKHNKQFTITTIERLFSQNLKNMLSLMSSVLFYISISLFLHLHLFILFNFHLLIQLEVKFIVFLVYKIDLCQ